MKKKILALFPIVCGAVLTASFSTTNALAEVGTIQSTQSIDNNQKQFQDIKGTHIIMNVTVVDEDDNLRLVPKYFEFKIEPGKPLTKEMLIEKGQELVNSVAPNEYKVVDISDDTKISISLKGYEQSHLIKNGDYTIPNLTKTVSNPGFQLEGRLIVEDAIMPVNLKPKKMVDKIEYEHNVTFFKKDGSKLVPTGVMKKADSGSFKSGDVKTSDELFDKANEAFKQTPEYKAGYKLVKRLTADLTTETTEHSTLFNEETSGDLDFTHTFNGYRDENKHDLYYDSISETYYISKNGDDYNKNVDSNEQFINIKLVDENGIVLKTDKLVSFTEDIVNDLKNYVKETGVETFNQKDGSTYQFTGDIGKESDKTYIIKYKQNNKSQQQTVEYGNNFVNISFDSNPYGIYNVKQYQSSQHLK
ncbi:hypothetical protein [Streptococcus phocae]|uniref:DUF4179 domain-containing protein n=1 Tax=Streptococcus phocae TaxID=119224 RepID=A0A0P6S119_9STRE|nr:hypothetical protein [Streptococcus phocae]KPJ22111.1 hypothetical protein AKK44_06335 [Streptococcus phocae]